MEQNESVKQSSSGMTVAEFFLILFKHWLFIIIVTAVISIVGVICCYFLVKPTYTAKATILIDCIETDSTPNATTKAEIEQNRYAIALANEIVPTLTDLAESDMVKKSVILASANNNEIEVVYKNGLSVKNNDGSIVVSFVYVTESGKAEAVATVNQIVKSLIDCTTITTVDKDGNEVAKYKSLSGYIKEGDIAETAAENNNWLLFSIITVLIGIFLSCSLVFILNYFDDTIRDKNLLEEITGFDVIAMIDDVSDDKSRGL